MDKKTTNPNDEKTRTEMLQFLTNIQEFKQEKFDLFLKNKIYNKRVLDIGVVEHDISYIDRKGWVHKQIKENSKYCVGVDILCDLVEVLNKKGYTVHCMDATSDEYIGEKFDVVYIGDVIEHVNNPVNLIKFAKRHLLEGGEIIVSTPNPYFYRYIRQHSKIKTVIDNFEHICWITPTMANEIARRAGVIFDKSIFLVSKNKIRRYLQKKSPENYSKSFIYMILRIMIRSYNGKVATL